MLNLPETETTVINFDEYFNQPETPETVNTIAYNVMDYPEDVEFPNHNPQGEEWLTLQDTLENPNLLQNNCGAITWAVIETITQELPDGYTAEEKTLTYNNGVHVAVLITDPQNKQHIIDYTAKQYDPTLPTPYITSKENWEKTIDSYVQQQFQDTRKK